MSLIKTNGPFFRSHHHVVIEKRTVDDDANSWPLAARFFPPSVISEKTSEALHFSESVALLGGERAAK
jgi:hypothetical protein